MVLILGVTLPSLGMLMGLTAIATQFGPVFRHCG